ncbi:exopolysaccharide biosynthesis protein [Phenylobacterium sp. NIBR 498073]|uniref:exopolysaccharide biosynthesis protein n=1 Tax=Phenylobacterium sp. NIBR 498073 TaxID=3015177 RepID=UPI0022B34249|nr:exopolysaccharide biosynthesis protein [Phenylobacterium sp. NIBR 498073]WGU41250.1 exopolysaccharide biosynthesis protein [Phenylobacterium sp. NIBR 498073]
MRWRSACRASPYVSAIRRVACTLIALVLVLPIPFANLAPAAALGGFALGLSRRDGLVVLSGYGLLALAFLVVALGVHGAAVGIRHRMS